MLRKPDERPMSDRRHLGRAGWMAALALMGTATLAMAQDAELKRPPAMPEPGTGIPEKIDPPLGTDKGAGEDGEITGTLSDRLNRSEGVIKPPSGVDPEIRVPAPEAGGAGTMKVIPPPGEPGGDPQIQPK